MRFAADTLATQAISSRPRVAFGMGCAELASSTWRTPAAYGFAGTKPSSPMVMIPVGKGHSGNLATRRLSEASP